jgi:hypothetical protein
VKVSEQPGEKTDVAIPQFKRPPVPHGPGSASGDDSVIQESANDFDNVVAYSADGSGNNPSNFDLGSPGSDEVRIAPANFAAGTGNTPVGGPNPRVSATRSLPTIPIRLTMAGDPRTCLLSASSSTTTSI